MRLKDRQKMCPQCEGRIPVDAEICQYCASDPSKVLSERLSAPYKVNSIQPVSEPMVERKIPTMSASMGIPTIPSSATEEVVTKDSKGIFMPTLLLCLAGNLLTIGLLQLLFSDRGFLRLEWDSSYWFLYCLGALPLFYVGLKKAGQ